MESIPRRSVDLDDVRVRVQDVYRQVAEDPTGEFHFERGRALAERLGYPVALLDRLPPDAIESFAGVGHPFELAGLQEGERVLDLGSGSGMDAFVAAHEVGPRGYVIGVDMTEQQLKKAEALRARQGLDHVEFRRGYIEEIPLEDAEVDVVISNGVINLSAEKERVFAEIARVLRPGGRMAISDIVTETQLSDNIVCDASLWAACIGGAAQQDRYRAMIERAGLSVGEVREHPEYGFLSKSATNASKDYGVKSVTLEAVKEAMANA